MVRLNLLHLSRPERGRLRGRFLDDYAFLIQALLDLYETDFRVSRLDDARVLMETLIERFQEEPGMPFRFTPNASDIMPTNAPITDL